MVQAQPGPQHSPDRLQLEGRSGRCQGLARALRQPYAQIVADNVGRVTIDFGVYGAPGTFLIDAAGVGASERVGPVTPTTSSASSSPPSPRSARRLREARRRLCCCGCCWRLAWPSILCPSRTPPRRLFQALARELRCLVCQNQNLADSDAGLAKRTCARKCSSRCARGRATPRSSATWCRAIPTSCCTTRRCAGKTLLWFRPGPAGRHRCAGGGGHRAPPRPTAAAALPPPHPPRAGGRLVESVVSLPRDRHAAGRPGSIALPLWRRARPGPGALAR